MASFTIWGRVFDHLEYARPIGDPVYLYLVKTESGYYIRKGTMDENMYKTVTTIYENDDLDAIVIIPADELPPDAEIVAVENEEEIM